MKAFRSGVSLLGELFITLGVLLLAFVGWQLWWTDVVSNRAQATIVSRLEQQFEKPITTSKPTPTTVPTVQLKVPLGEAFALVRVPRWGKDYVRPVREGTNLDILDEGIGHYTGTAMPGEIGNFATAGHRTTYGKPYTDVDTLRVGDLIVVETRAAYDVYAVSGHEIVLPTQVSVIDAVPNQPRQKPTKAVMTMTSCNPRFSAAQRYVVHAQLTAHYTRQQGLPASVLTTPSGG